MKKNFLRWSAFAVVALLFAACSPEEPSFDEGMLFGKWQETGKDIYYMYKQDYTGTTWGEDVGKPLEEDADRFTWTLEQSLLTQIITVEIGGSIPQTFTVTELTAKSLVYKDDFDVVYRFKKVE